MTGRTMLLEADKDVRKPLLRAYDDPLCDDEDCIHGVELIMTKWIAAGRFARFTALRSSGAWFAKHAKSCPERRLCYNCEECIEDAIDEERKKVFGNLGRFLRSMGGRHNNEGERYSALPWSRLTVCALQRAVPCSEFTQQFTCAYILEIHQ